MPVQQNLPKVLIVDDEDLFRQMMELVLSQEFSVVTAASAAEGLAAYERFKPDAVLLDVVMPEMNGLSALKIIRQKDPDTPVLMITGFPRYESAHEALEEGATRYIEKPVSPQELIQAVRQGICRGLEARKGRTARQDAQQLFEELQAQRKAQQRAEQADTAGRRCVDDSVDQALVDLRAVGNLPQLPAEACRLLMRTQLRLLCARDLSALAKPLEGTSAQAELIHAAPLIESVLREIQPWARALGVELDVHIKVGPSHTLESASRQRKLVRSFLASVVLDAPPESTVRGEMAATDEHVELRLLEPGARGEAALLVPSEILAALHTQLQIRQADGRGRARILLWH